MAGAPRRQAHGACPAYSADGLLIAFSADLDPRPDRVEYELAVMPAAGGDITVLTDTPGRAERDPCWSPDGNLIAFTRDQELVVYDRQAGAVRNDFAMRASGPCFSPSGTELAFVWATRDGEAPSLCGLDLASGAVRRLVDPLGEIGWLSGGQPSWSPDGRSILFVSVRDSEPPPPWGGIPTSWSPTCGIYSVSLGDLSITPVWVNPKSNLVYPRWVPGRTTAVRRWAWGQVKASLAGAPPPANAAMESPLQEGRVDGGRDAR